MILTAAEILAEDLLRLSQSKGEPAQVGYDLSIKSIQQIVGGGGVFTEHSTLLPEYETVEKVKINTVEVPNKESSDRKQSKKDYPDKVKGWQLQAGAVYDITFLEGVDLPDNRTAMIRQRSSLMRNGVLIQSSIFDPGFSTDNIGCVLFCFTDFFIEEDSRLAQIYFHTHNAVAPEALYDGQFANDKQRSES